MPGLQLVVHHPSDGFIGGGPLVGDAYTLQISVEGVPVVPEPGRWMLMALGLGALAWRTRHRGG